MREGDFKGDSGRERDKDDIHIQIVRGDGTSDMEDTINKGALQREGM